MPVIGKHVETTFSYSDLSTTDLEDAKRWTRREPPTRMSSVGRASRMDDMSGGIYTMFQKNGQPVCGLMSVPAPNMPSFWLVYFAVADCGDTVAKAKEIGAQIMRDPTPIPGVGTPAPINDPQGAGFGVLEAESR